MSKNNAGIGGTVLAVVVTLAVAGAGGYMIGARSAKPDLQTVASVNGIAITRSALNDRLFKTNGAEAVSRMIDEEIINQAAKAAGVTVTPADVDKEIAKIKEQIGGEEKFNAALQQYNITVDQLKEDSLSRLKVTKILSKDIKTDDATLEKYFTDNLAQFDTTREVRTRHILLKTEDEAKAVKADLDKGADFTTLAKEKSIDPTAKDNGGDMGFNPRGKMVAEYDTVVFGLKKGEISAPFQSQFGWHVAQLVDTKGEAPTFAGVKAKVQEAYVSTTVSEKMQSWLDEQKAKAKITNTLEKK